ncbi:DUF262 domain-containing protein [Treponema parvum]|uniref:DUF262 domain-containing protein n=1 Tax=Treponema parvum TaxID=138851 RepID=UPI001AEBAC0A|nr:DUF262 domain-containing protein [Treponema parvum]QTQ15237.1 DUF262 domain-containing protein [Treponema parvum]
MTNTFTLKEISNKTIDGICVEIPSIQRGLVWTPRQVEFLWDSILRDFPIGGFVLSENNKGSYDLLDGQQRFNSIQIGFAEPDKESKAILWLDLKLSDMVRGITRKYYVKATTISHPWGYKNNDECSVLSAKERRAALTLYYDTDSKNIYKDDIKIIDTYPFESRDGFPIPLAFFLNNDSSNAEDFLRAITKSVESLPEKWQIRFWNENNKKLLNNKKEELYELFSRIKSTYKVPFSILPKGSMERESNTEVNPEEKSDLEILFNRLNTGGTRITQSDLSYSAIKAYWSEINSKNEELAKQFMPAPKLVMLLFRLYLTLEIPDCEKFESQLTIKKIRSLALDQEKKKKIADFFLNDDKAKKILDSVKYALIDIPKFVQMRILSEKQECFLLLFFLAAKEFDLNEINAKGLVLLLFWFCLDINYACNTLLKSLSECCNKTDVLKKIRDSICSLIENEKIVIIYSPQDIKGSLLNENGVLKEDFKRESVFPLLRRILSMKTCLVYAQRNYLDSIFPKFNPADTISWEDHNRPWDYDHIMPKDWSYNHFKSVLKTRVDFWRDTIANLAAIPFEINRAKSNYDNYDYYSLHTKELFFDEGYRELNSSITSNEQMVTKFENLSFQRFIQIYSECYKVFSDLIVYNEPERISMLKNIISKVGNNAKLYFINPPSPYEIEVTKQIDYLHSWLSVEIELSKNCMLSFTWYKSLINKCEFGLRKHINSYEVDRNCYNDNKELFDDLVKDFRFNIENKGWWYLHSESIKPEQAAEKILEVYARIKDRIK